MSAPQTAVPIDATSNLLVLVIDRLNAGALGPYGNTWIPTPAINDFAGRSQLFEFAFTTSSDLVQVYRSYWQGLHPLARESENPAESLPHQWRHGGRHTVLVTDEPRVSSLPLAQEFADQVVIENAAVAKPAETVAETQFAALIAATVEQLHGLRQPFALWMHAQGPEAVWDAPLELREHLRDEDDPPPLEIVAPPRLRLPQDYDPDELTAVSQAYAAQVVAIDECLESLWSALPELKSSRPLQIVLTAPRGYLLGQQRYVGGDALFEDLLHVPLITQWPHEQLAAQREHRLAEPRDLYHLLGDAGQVASAGRDRIVAVAPGERSLRTQAWYLRQVLPVGAEDSPGSDELYAKPDDRFEVNDVAARCQDVRAQLVEVLAATAEHLACNSTAELPELAAELVDTIR